MAATTWQERHRREGMLLPNRHVRSTSPGVCHLRNSRAPGTFRDSALSGHANGPQFASSEPGRCPFSHSGDATHAVDWLDSSSPCRRTLGSQRDPPAGRRRSTPARRRLEKNPGWVGADSSSRADADRSLLPASHGGRQSPTAACDSRSGSLPGGHSATSTGPAKIGERVDGDSKEPPVRADSPSAQAAKSLRGGNLITGVTRRAPSRDALSRTAAWSQDISCERRIVRCGGRSSSAGLAAVPLPCTRKECPRRKMPPVQDYRFLLGERNGPLMGYLHFRPTAAT